MPQIAIATNGGDNDRCWLLGLGNIEKKQPIDIKKILIDIDHQKILYIHF